MRDIEKPLLDPRAKLAWFCVLLLLVFLFSQPFVQLGLAGLVIVLIVVGSVTGNLSPSSFLGALKILAGMLIAVILLQGFFQPGETILFQFRLFQWPIRFKLEGVFFGLVIASRFITISFAFMMFFMTTSAYQLSVGLYKLGIPYKYAYLVSMALDRLPRTMGIMEDIEYAQGARGFDIERGGAIQKFRNIIPILIPLVILSLREADQMSVALELRGFDSAVHPTFIYDLEFRALDRVLIVLAGLTAVVAVVYRIAIAITVT